MTDTPNTEAMPDFKSAVAAADTAFKEGWHTLAIFKAKQFSELKPSI